MQLEDLRRELPMTEDLTLDISPFRVGTIVEVNNKIGMIYDLSVHEECIVLHTLTRIASFKNVRTEITIRIDLLDASEQHNEPAYVIPLELDDIIIGGQSFMIINWSTMYNYEIEITMLREYWKKDE